MSREVSEETFAALEILQPLCAERYGVAPCAAQLGPAGGTVGSPPVANTGTHKCHNTRATCQDPDNYAPTDTVVLRFVRAQELPLSYGPFIPALRELKVAPGSINFAGMESGINPFGQREEVTATLADFKHSGHQLDPYRLERQTGDASLLDSGDAQAGAADTLTLKAGAPESFAGTPVVRLVAGAGSVQERPLLSFDGTTKVATVSPRWQVNHMLRTEDYEVAPWANVVGGTATRANTASPVHSGNACLVTATSDLGGIRQTVTLPALSTNHMWSFYIERGTCNDVSIRLENGSAGYGQVLLRNLNLVTAAITGGSGLVTATADGNGWRVVCNLGLSKASPTVTANCEIRAVLNGDTFIIAQPCIEEGTAEPVAYLATGAAAITLPDSTTDYEIRDAFDPYDRGTFIGKWLARNPYYGNYRARWRRGRVGQALEDMHVRSYVVNNISGPSEGGAWSVKLRDLFSKVEARKAVFPLPSVGKLSAALTGSPGTFAVAPTGIGNTAENEGGYANLTAGHVRIGDEAVQITRSGDTFTVVGRGALGTTAEDHDEDDLVQAVGALSAEIPHEHIYTLLTGYSGVPAANIPKAEWDAHMAGYANTYLTWVTEPTPVETLSGEIQEQAGLSVWHDPETDEIKLRRLRPEGAAPTVNDDGWIMRGSLKVSRQEAKRASRVMMYFGMRNYTRDLDDPNNFHQRVLVPDLASEGSDQHGSLSLRKIFSRWIVAGGLQSATDSATRIASIFRDPPREASFELFASRSGQLALAQPFMLETNQIQDKDTGLAQAVTMVPTRLFEDEHAISVQAQELAFKIDLGDPNVREITISTTLYNVNLRALHDSLFAPLTGAEVVTFTIEASGVVGSTSTGAYAIDTGDWPAMSTPPKLVINGRGQGKGGKGGNNWSTVQTPENGFPGGPALKVRVAFTLDGTGKIWSGGGGGGGGDSNTGPGGGGGGGAGTDGGDGGFGWFRPSQDGVPGTAEAGGDGNDPGGFSAVGGDGGGPGLAGSGGSSGELSGGATGTAIDGVSFVTFEPGHTLDIRGPQV